MNTIRPASHPSTNERVFEIIVEEYSPGKRILDVGAGRGFMVQRIGNYIGEKGGKPGELLFACDLYPEYFEYTAIKCEKVHFLTSLLYQNDSFDIVYAIEVIEHLRNPYDFIKEAYRVLRPGGKLILTTPNILNLTSRVSFLMRGFFMLFPPVSYNEKNAGSLSGHIMPLSYYYLDYGMRKEGFSRTIFYHDRIKKSALLLYGLLFPFFTLSSLYHRIKIKRKDPLLYDANAHALSLVNNWKMLVSRSCILVGNK